MDGKIRLSNVDEAKELIMIASACDFDVTLKRGSLMVDAKSIIGVLSLDLRGAIDLIAAGEDEKLNAFVEAHRA